MNTRQAINGNFPEIQRSNPDLLEIYPWFKKDAPTIVRANFFFRISTHSELTHCTSVNFTAEKLSKHSMFIIASNDDCIQNPCALAD